jgi:hypothetical protein
MRYKAVLALAVLLFSLPAHAKIEDILACLQLLKKEGLPALARAARRYYDNTTPIFDESTRRAETVLSVGDSMIVRQAGQLRLARFTTLNTDHAQAFPLMGDEVLEARKINTFYMIRTRSQTNYQVESYDGSPADFTDLLYFIPDTLENSFYHYLTANAEVSRHSLPEQKGEAVVVLNSLIVISKTKPENTYPASLMKSSDSALAQIRFDGTITNVRTTSSLPMRAPVMEVEHQSKRTGGSVKAFVDFELHQQLASLPNASAPILFTTPAKANITWISEIAGQETDFAAIITGTEIGLGPGRIISVLTSKREANQRRVTELGLPQHLYKGLNSIRPVRVLSGNGTEVYSLSFPKDPYPERASLIAFPSTNTRASRHLIPNDRVGGGKAFPLPQVVADAHTETITTPDGRDSYFIVENDPNQGKSRFTSEGVLFSSCLPIEYLILDDPGTIGSNHSAFQFSSNARWKIRTSHPKEGFLGKHILWAELSKGDSNTPISAIIDLKKAETTLLPGVLETKLVEVEGKSFILFYGASSDSIPPQKYFAVYDLAHATFLTATNELSKVAGFSEYNFTLTAHSFTGSPIPHSNNGRYRVIAPSPFEEEPAAWKINPISDNGQIWIVGTSSDSPREKAAVVIQSKQSNALVFTSPSTIDVDIPKETPLKNGARTARSTIFIRELIRSVNEGAYEESTRVTAILPDGRTHAITVPGTVKSLRYEPVGNAWKLVGEGNVQLISGGVPTIFHWLLGTNNPTGCTVIVNQRSEPVKLDDVAIFVTDAYANNPPRVYYQTMQMTVPKEIELRFDLPKKERNLRPLTNFLAFTFKLPEEDEVTPQNQNDISSVESQGELIFIHTRANAGTAPKTYVWSKKTQKLVFSITNYVGYYDEGPLRFYVGQATSLNDSVIAVFNRESHQFITYFDFKRLRLAVEDDFFIRRNQEKNQIEFKIRGGLTRIFDETQNTFVGLLPQRVKDVMSSVEDSIGTTLNTVVFMNATEPLFRRDAFSQELAKSVMPADSEGLTENVLIVSPHRAGTSHIIEDFINKWISGEIPESAEAQIVFFRVDPWLATSDTKYRGTFAAKFKELRGVGQRLSEMGYRLVLVMENLQSYDSTPHNFMEGDIFSNVVNIVNDRRASLLATVTPHGLEKLSRECPEIIHCFRRQLPLAPMSIQETLTALRDYLDLRKAHGALTEGQLETLVTRIQQLQLTRALPGSAFDLLKELLSRELDWQGKQITNQHIQEVLAKRSGIPRILLDEENFRPNRLKMINEIQNRVILQDPIVIRIVNALFAFAQNIDRSDWPIYRGLFPGLSGTGKTELARAIAEFLFGSDKAMLRINGSEFCTFKDSERLTRIIADYIKTNPFNLILFDEFEKMHPDARNVVLNLGDGNISDQFGNPVSAALTILLLTSNLGEEAAKTYIAENRDTVEEEAMFQYLEKIFKEAVHNGLTSPIQGRFDVYVFKPLTSRAARKLVRDYMESETPIAAEPVAHRFKRRGITLTFDDSAIDYMADEYVDLEFGGRKLVRLIETNLVNDFLSIELLEGRLVPGGTWHVGWNGQHFTLNTSRPPK